MKPNFLLTQQPKEEIFIIFRLGEIRYKYFSIIHYFFMYILKFNELLWFFESKTCSSAFEMTEKDNNTCLTDSIIMSYVSQMFWSIVTSLVFLVLEIIWNTANRFFLWILISQIAHVMNIKWNAILHINCI